jgi:hypothetical protein
MSSSHQSIFRQFVALASEVNGSYELGRADTQYTCQHFVVDALVNSAPDGSPGLVGGYLRARQERDPERCLALIQDLSVKSETKRFFPAIVMQSGLTDANSAILAHLVDDGDMPVHYLRGLFSVGNP